METEIYLHNDSELLDYGEKISTCFTKCTFSFSVFFENNDDLAKILTSTKELKEVIISQINAYSSMDNDNQGECAYLENILNNVDHIWDYIDYVHLDFDPETNLSLLSSIKNIKTKKIVVSKNFNVCDYNDVVKLMKTYKDHLDYVYVSMQGCNEYIKITDCFETICKIKDIANEIKKLNLSPLESIMYSYDIVRDKVYKFEDIGDSPNESRSLSSIMSGDKIVCAGYANYFNALLFYMNIKNNVVILDQKNNPNSSHARNVVRVQDPKYQIDGVYYFDTTWDSRKENETNEYLNHYLFFAKTREQFIQIEEDKYIDHYYPYYSTNMVNEIKEMLESEDFMKINKECASSLNFMSEIVNNTRLIDRECLLPFHPKFRKFNQNKLLKKLGIIEDVFNRPISAETFIQLLNNVRKIEYYIDSEKYPYTLNKLYETYIRSDWNFDQHYYSNFDIQLMHIFNMELENRKDKKEDFIEYSKKNEIAEDTKYVALTKILRDYCNKKNDQGEN